MPVISALWKLKKGGLQVQGQPAPHSQVLSQNNKIKYNKKEKHD
jgi:hypothetical protein